MASEEDRRPLPPSPLECRQNAEQMLARSGFETAPVQAVAWALLAIAGSLSEIQRAMRKQR